MAEWTAVARQIVNPGEAIVFTENPRPCTKSLIKHRDDSGAFNLNGRALTASEMYGCQCCCMRDNSIDYEVSFGANIAVPTGGTVGPISVAFSVGGFTLQGTTMIVTPAAVEEFFNVSRDTGVPVFKGCCQDFAIINTSSIPIAVENANVKINR